ncbi:DUF3558 domain-containing protein [Nocardia sp. NPDC060259]|uniref:DUF3558 domain-containing protein n=1 Tax=Nocardia sp. NPDC060259 TaxID=3347088 RepID=UPI0036670084
MKPGTIIGCILVALAASACSSTSGTAGPESSASGGSAGSTATQSARPTLTDPKLQPPSQENKNTQSTARPKVVFDPCTWISDADIESVGFRPGSRKRGSDLVAEYTFLTCDFRNPDHTVSLGLDSGNITWDENLQKNGPWLEATTVNGRQAGLVRGDPGGENACKVHLRTNVGVVFVRTLVLSLGREQNLDPCANIMEIASVVEKSIGKEN